jgi:hypothetical protein
MRAFSHQLPKMGSLTEKADNAVKTVHILVSSGKPKEETLRTPILALNN